MLFTEPRFIVFLAAVFALYWSLDDNADRKRLLLLASAAFYALWDWRFVGLVFGSAALNFFAVRLMLRATDTSTRRSWLVVGIASNLLILGIFKYFNFFVESAQGVLTVLGLDPSLRTLEIVLPVGISFYTFQSMSYTIDVFRGRMQASESLSDFCLYVAFFPQLVAGPIVRASSFLPQLGSSRRFSDVRIQANLSLFLIGFVKKACIADQLARMVDPVFADPDRFTVGAKWLAAVLYHIQIYCDFSGYTDMAIAAAGLLGYRLTRNFDFPYLATSIRDFWRRWHISLSTWFRDYLYIPMGGGRASRLRVSRNLWVVFLLCGLWHGAAWTFVVWGLLHGALSIVERAGGDRWLAALPKVVGLAYVQVAVITAWVIFRSPDMASAVAYLGGMVGWPSQATSSTDSLALGWWALVFILAAVHVIASRVDLVIASERLPDWVFAIAFGAAVALALPWVATEYVPFIYFQF